MKKSARTGKNARHTTCEEKIIMAEFFFPLAGMLSYLLRVCLTFKQRPTGETEDGFCNMLGMPRMLLCPLPEKSGKEWNGLIETSLKIIACKYLTIAMTMQEIGTLNNGKQGRIYFSSEIHEKKTNNG